MVWQRIFFVYISGKLSLRNALCFPVGSITVCYLLLVFSGQFKNEVYGAGVVSLMFIEMCWRPCRHDAHLTLAKLFLQKVNWLIISEL